MTEYLNSRGDLSSATLRFDSLAIRSLMDVVGEGTAVKAVTVQKIEKFKVACRDRGMKPHSINSYLRHLQAAFNTALEWGYIEKPLKIKRVKTPRNLPRILLPKEREAILANAKETDFEMWRIILFTLWTGCRREEVLRIKWSNVQLRGEPRCIVRGKGNKERIVPLLPPTLEAMGEPKDLGPVFHQFHKDTVSHRFKRISRECGIEDVHFHNLRHSAATQMIESGVIGEVVQRILGHSDYRTTQIYVNLSQSTLAEEMKKFKY